MDSGLLHTAARRHLMARGDRFAAAILVEVERLDPDRLPDAKDVGRALMQAAAGAHPSFARDPDDQAHATEMADERRLFQETVRSWLTDGLPEVVRPLPYRRVLTEAESQDRLRLLEQRWGVTNMCWHPMIARDDPPGVLIVSADSVWQGPGADHVRRVLREAGVGRVTELREYGPGYLLDVNDFAPCYTGAEGVWSDDSLAWIAYASHEETVAFGGELAVALEAGWDDLDRWRWTGW